MANVHFRYVNYLGRKRKRHFIISRQTDGWSGMDRQMTSDRNTTLCTEVCLHRAVKKRQIILANMSIIVGYGQG